MNEQNWIRKYLLDVGPQGGKGIRIGNTDGTDTQEVLRISFSVDKSDTSASNNASIKIWNLSPDSLKVLDEKDCVAILRAGYGNNTPVIITGLVTNVVTEPDGADRVTSLEVVDGRMELRDTNIVVSMSGAVNTKDAYEYIAKQMGLTLLLAEDLTYQDIPNGLSFTGKGKDLLERVAGANNHEWSIQSGILQVYWKGRPVSQKVYLLSANTGLLGIPKKITISENDDNNASLTGYEIDYFFNGAIGVNEMVQIQSKTVNGYYRVYKLSQEGDNFSGDWKCRAQVLEVKPLPAVDKKATDAVAEQSLKEGEPVSATESNTTIKQGDTVKVINSFKQGGQTQGFLADGGTFTVDESEYNVISTSGDKVAIGKGTSIIGTVKKSDIQKVE